MKLRITVEEVDRWKTSRVSEPPIVKTLMFDLNQIFCKYSPRRLTNHPFYDYHELDFAPEDAAIEANLQAFNERVQLGGANVYGHAEVFLTPAEVKRARFLELFTYGDNVDEESNYPPANPSQRILCKACNFPDISHVPDLLLVSRT